MESIHNFNFDEIESLRDKLLDMSLRNKLLNFKPKKVETIEIVDENISSLYNIIVLKSHNMRFYSKDYLDKTNSNNSNNLNGEYTQTNNVELDNIWSSDDKIKESHLDNFLQTNYSNEELQKRLKALYRKKNQVKKSRASITYF